MEDPKTDPRPLRAEPALPAPRVLRLRVDGETHTVACAPSETLLEVLRYRLGRTGTKQGCDKGDCGACTVLLDGKPQLACLTLAALCEGRSVRTVEGLARGAGPEGLHPMQAAFNRHGAAQCGFCTPGMLMSATHFAEARAKARAAGDAPQAPPSHEEIAQALSGNLCRCTGYTKILEAVQEATIALGQAAPAARQAPDAPGAPDDPEEEETP